MLMSTIDPAEHIALRRAELLAEAKQQRLLAQLPPRTSGLRHAIALACHCLANWLDNPARYVQPPESGPEHWATPCANA
jgi:hypothetical protein